MIANRLRDALEQRATLKDPPEWMLDALTYGGTNAGVSVNEATAVRDPTVAACVNVIAQGVAGMPLIVYERIDERNRRRATDDPMNATLRLRPNPEMSAFELFEAFIGHACLWGRSHLYIENRRGRRTPPFLWPIPPNIVEPDRDKETNRLTGWTVKVPGRDPVHLRPSELLTIRAQGWTDKSPIQRHRETIGLAIAAEQFGARFFGQGANTSGFVVMPPEATEAQAKATEAELRAKHEGLERSHLLGILQGGVTWQDVGMPLKDAEYIEGQKFSVEQKCRIFGVKLHKVQHLERATFSNIEHQGIEHVVDTLGPWIDRTEQAFTARFFTTERSYGMPGDRFCEFLVDKLLRGDVKTRNEAYAVAVQWGWMTRAEVRRRENLPEIDGLEKPMRPANMLVDGETLDDVDPQLRALAAMLARNAHVNGNGNGSSALAATLPDEVSE